MKKGFTLVEIMIVVGVIGVIAIITLPNFIKSRERARYNICISDLRTTTNAKHTWAVLENYEGTDTPTWSQLVPTYLKDTPSCPAGGSYTLNTVDTVATCSFSGHAL